MDMYVYTLPDGKLEPRLSPQFSPSLVLGARGFGSGWLKLAVRECTCIHVYMYTAGWVCIVYISTQVRMPFVD